MIDTKTKIDDACAIINLIKLKRINLIEETLISK